MIKFNKNIEDAINSTIIPKVSGIHQLQVETAKQVIKSFTAHETPEDEHESRNNHIILCAPPQAGKTGVSTTIPNILISSGLDKSYFKIKKYYYICGQNENALHTQTYDRVKKDLAILGITEEHIVKTHKEIGEKPNAFIFVLKNSHMKSSNPNAKNPIEKKLDLDNSLIFIDENHFGTGDSNVLTIFLENNGNGIDWKNDNKILKDKKTFIISISATSFDEIISDVKETKTIVSLDVSEDYISISHYLKNKQIHEAENTTEHILEKLNDSYIRMIENERIGVCFVRTKNKNITSNKELKKLFEIVFIDSSDGKIDYEKIKTNFKHIFLPGHKPILFFVKAAYRAGQTLTENFENDDYLQSLGNPNIKDYTYLVYDCSGKVETTSQGLLGRFCGYRKDKTYVGITDFYVTVDHAEQYSIHEADFKNRNNIPSDSNIKEEIDIENIESSDKLKAIFMDRFKILLNSNQINEIKNNTETWWIFLKPFLANHFPHINYDYIGETYMLKKDGAEYADGIKKRYFHSEKSINGFRPDKSGHFKSVFSRTKKTDLDIYADYGKIIIHIGLNMNELGDYELIIMRGKLTVLRSKIKRTVSTHKNTTLV